MEYRPKISLPYSNQDKLLEGISLLLLLVLWLVAIRFYSLLPDIVPIHFDGKGQADGYSRKGSLFLLPLIATIIYGGTTLLNKHPDIFNYGVSITPENAHRLYSKATRFLRVLKLLVLILFLIIVVVVIRTSLHNGTGPGPLFLPFLLTPLILLAGWSLVSAWNEH
ncbi:MAG TPA: DUF1648 domain-containing protein [Flavisolibacter sp.]|nr:DUF1648 domain-containing protein [Flavisolibacter sp.]